MAFLLGPQAQWHAEGLRPVNVVPRSKAAADLQERHVWEVRHRCSPAGFLLRLESANQTSTLMSLLSPLTPYTHVISRFFVELLLRELNSFRGSTCTLLQR